MTVQRHSGDYHYAAPTDDIGAVQILQARRPPYYPTRKIINEILFKAAESLNWLLMGMRMNIKIGPEPGDARISTDIKSQWFIIGYFYGTHYQYPKRFMGKFQIKMQRIEPHMQ